MEPKAAREALRLAGLCAVEQGSGEAVTAQLPAAQTSMEQGSQVLVYLGDAVPETVVVPDFTGMTLAQAEKAAADAGLTLCRAGNPDSERTLQVQLQDIPPDTRVEPGRTVTITFTDPTAQD